MQPNRKISLGSIQALKDYVGAPAISGEAIVVDQQAIDTFAAVTHDQQWIHVDPARAATDSPFGTTIAHGLFTLSLITGWYHRVFEFPGRKLALNYGFDKVRFTAPVKSGAALVGSFRLEQVQELNIHEARCHWHVEVTEVGAERPALVAQWIMQLRY